MAGKASEVPSLFRGGMFLPSKLVASIRQKAMLEPRCGNYEEDPWLSENDIVTAILYKVALFYLLHNGLYTPLTSPCSSTASTSQAMIKRLVIPCTMSVCVDTYSTHLRTDHLSLITITQSPLASSHLPHSTYITYP